MRSDITTIFVPSVHLINTIETHLTVLLGLLGATNYKIYKFATYLNPGNDPNRKRE